ncbi:rhodanese [Desulfoprunum benzoelyticum]|uniref:Rhodanese-related sulfurtransferase n=1 Tax=Desulfoprunum benzoelyticum TaxID=1506996 RepID=A0A840UP05_9BACT|nr:rhodanese-like domain-containing protein [Desulfoprunum benzoelyticum]MBB5347365.1 rhodanese-related sulfurtransferase [Desulfoprunum benzoelyticum]MBM9530956.1 rhodanese [Desulfoprunum benzoelyticum]
MSTKNAGLAKKLGYTNIRVYLDGEPAWAKSGLPTFATYDFVTNGNVVLIDIRSRDKVVAGRIPRAVSIPYFKLEDRLDDIPRNAPVILYSDDLEEVTTAINEMRDDGFNFVAAVRGNFQGWVENGGKLVKGPILSTEINWQRKLGKGEVSVADFKKATEGQIPNTVVVDARTKEEVAELGLFKNTINIPLDELTKRMNELPKDKQIFIHCSTGARADMAYQQLIKNGYNVKFLLLNIEDAECDCEIIRP